MVEAVNNSPGFRQRIRQSLVDFPLMDEKGILRELEAAYRQMWRYRCAQQRQFQAT